MISPTLFLWMLIVLSILLAFIFVVRPSVTTTRGGKILAFVVLFILPVLCAAMGTSQHIENSKQTKFCLSCHIMEPYGKSLLVDDPSYLAAAHYQNHRVPPEQACYTCHTDYTLYGDVHSKLRGLRHVYINYLSKPAQPIRLYSAYNNRECLHCHLGARSFEQGAVHNVDPATLPAIKANQLSCLSSGCHATVHNVEQLNNVKFWKAAQ
ncbi:MAG TPA: NapC/NirT family cytochrome c [Candidatus Dormibacteraeota bacterium]|nr:NapC/NirT family cytochrome c [Candidatus Dormibacteraeota bacterium]